MRYAGGSLVAIISLFGFIVGFAAQPSSALPDLTVISLSFEPAQPQPGDLIIVNAVLTNRGTADASAAVVARLSLGFVLDEFSLFRATPLFNDLTIATHDVGPIKAGEQQTTSFPWRVMELPLMRLRVTVDATDLVVESDEGNNRAERALRLRESAINQWWLEQISAVPAHEISQGSREVIVAVLDTGVDYRHPELADHSWVNAKEIPDNKVDDDGNGYVDDVYGWDFVDDDGDALKGSPLSFHGTAVAGLIAAAADGWGITGVAPRVTIMGLRMLSTFGSIREIAKLSRAIDYAVANGAHIINMSLGMGGCQEAETAAPVREAVERALAAGVVVVAAAGNEALDCVGFPAAYTDVIAVAATTKSGRLAAYSNFGERVDVAAPGGSGLGDLSRLRTYAELAERLETLKNNLISAYQGEGYGWFSGTSAATPLVSGVVALMRSVNPSLTSEQIRAILRETSTTAVVAASGDRALSFARVNTRAAVERASR